MTMTTSQFYPKVLEILLCILYTKLRASSLIACGVNDKRCLNHKPLY